MNVTRRIKKTLFSAAICALLPLSGHALAGEEFIIVQSTTSTRDSGLYDFILPVFEEKTGIDVRVVAVGTGQAIRNSRDCNGDVLLVHSKPDEAKFVAEGYGIKRFDVMYNDFVIIGPKSDPAGIMGTDDVGEALKKIAGSASTFASRGDDSGTNKAELRLWRAAGIDAKAASGTWYLETGSGMGKTLTFSVGKGTYTMSDRATWAKYGNKNGHVILVEGHPPLFNQYGAVVVNPEKCPNVKAEAGKRFVNWLVSGEGQKKIGEYRIEGQQLFYPNANAVSN